MSKPTTKGLIALAQQLADRHNHRGAGFQRTCTTCVLEALAERLEECIERKGS